MAQARQAITDGEMVNQARCALCSTVYAAPFPPGGCRLCGTSVLVIEAILVAADGTVEVEEIPIVTKPFGRREAKVIPITTIQPPPVPQNGPLNRSFWRWYMMLAVLVCIYTAHHTGFF